MGDERSVKLHGSWTSPFTMRAAIALKVKGIEFENIEEDLSNKSELLLKYNPVHKKIPVLVHNGQPIAESSVILEYIEEVWPEPPHLLPKDPYLRAKHRFWAAYFNPLLETLWKMLMTVGESQQNAKNELLDKLDVAEQGMKEIFPSGVQSFKKVNPGYLDIVFYSLLGTHQAATEFSGIKFFTRERYPLLVSWIDALSEVPEVKAVTPPGPKLVTFLHFIRQKYLPQSMAEEQNTDLNHQRLLPQSSRTSYMSSCIENADCTLLKSESTTHHSMSNSLGVHLYRYHDQVINDLIFYSLFALHESVKNKNETDVSPHLAIASDGYLRGFEIRPINIALMAPVALKMKKLKVSVMSREYLIKRVHQRNLMHQFYYSMSACCANSDRLSIIEELADLYRVERWSFVNYGPIPDYCQAVDSSDI